MLDGEGTAAPEVAAADAEFDKTLDAAFGNEAPAPTPAAPAKAAPGEDPAAAPPPPKAVPQQRSEEPAPAAEPAPVGDEPAPAPEIPAPTEAEAPTEETEADAPAFTFSSDGEDVEIPGSAVGSDGFFIPKAQEQEFTRLLAAGRSVLQGHLRQQLSQNATREKQWEAAVKAARAQVEHITSTIGKMIEEGTFQDWIENQHQNWPVLQAEAAKRAAEVELAEERRTREEYEARAERQQVEPQMHRALERLIVHYGEQAGLDGDTMSALYDRLSRGTLRERIFYRAAEADPQNNIRKGQWMVDMGLVADEVAWAGRGRAPKGKLDEVKDLQEKNKRLAGKPSGAPPTPAAKRGPAPAATVAKLPDFKTAEEADAEIWDRDGYKKLRPD